MRGWRMQRTGAEHEVLELADLPDPKPGRCDLVIDVEHAGISFADSLLIRGEYQVALPLPCVPGAELIGTVVGAGSATTIPVGTRVIGLGKMPYGAYAQQTIALEMHCEPVPADLPGPQGVSLIGNYVTAHLALYRRARMQAGDKVLVHGAAGGVGTALVQIAKAGGAFVIAADLGEDRAASCLDVGADVAFDATDIPLFQKNVRAACEGHGVDVVIDLVGGELFEASRRVIAFEGRIVIVGFTSGTIPQLRMNQLLLRSYAVLGVNALTVATEYPDIHHQARAAVVGMLGNGVIAPPIGAVRSYLELPTVFQDLRSGVIKGKAVIEFPKR